MKAKLLSVLAVCLLLLSFSAFADGHIVAFKGNGAPSDFAARVAALGGTITYQHSVLALVSGLSDAAAATLGASNGIAEVQADETFSLDATAIGTDEAYDVPSSVTAPSTAAFYPRQWHLRAIGANLGWAAGRLGSPAVRVAVLDTGIDRRNPITGSASHPDLAGHVDYASGMQFQLDNPACIPAGFTFNGTDDLMFHGTHVAATISSNAVAAAGVTSRVTLIPVKVLGLTKDSAGVCNGGSGSLGAVLSGVLYAADIDADVANMSLGGGFVKAGNGRFVGLISKTFNYAHSKGTAIVVAAGNEGADLDHDGGIYSTYCNSPNTICVSATGPTSSAGTNGPWANVDAPAFYTNYGRSSISVAAPGGSTGGSVTAACSRSAVSAGLSICQTGTFVVGSLGTSMASPHVAGLAALLVEDIGKDHPSQIKTRLQQSADDLGQPGTDPVYGKGRINVPRALGLQ